MTDTGHVRRNNPVRTRAVNRMGSIVMAKDLEGMRVAILATSGVEQPELTEPRKTLDEAGARTTLMAPKSGKIKAMKHDQPGDEFDVDMTLDRANPEDFDAVLLP